MSVAVPAISISCQRLRNLTTGRLHTKITDVYEDLITFTGKKTICSHDLPVAFNLVMPWLRQSVTDPRFWDNKYDTTHTGFITVRLPNEAYKTAINFNSEFSDESIPLG